MDMSNSDDVSESSISSFIESDMSDDEGNHNMVTETNTNTAVSSSSSSSSSYSVINEISKISTIIDKSKSKTTRNRLWVFIWKNYPLDFEKYLKDLMIKSCKYLFQTELNNAIFGFIYFKSAIAHSTLEKTNRNIIENRFTTIEWRKPIIHMNDLIDACYQSKTRKGPTYKKEI